MTYYVSDKVDLENFSQCVQLNEERYTTSLTNFSTQTDLHFKHTEDINSL